MPRLDELIKASKQVKTPILSIYLDQSKIKSEALAEKHAQRVACALKHITVGDLALQTSIVYSPSTCFDESTREGRVLQRWQTTVPPASRQARTDEFGPLLDWLLRIDLSRSRLLEQRMSVASVGQAVLHHYDGAVEVICSDENDVGEDVMQSDDGGFVFVRMHAYALFDAMRTVLPTHHRTVLRQVELALEVAQSTRSGTASDARVKKRKRRDANNEKDAQQASADRTTTTTPTTGESAKADFGQSNTSTAAVDDSKAIWGNLDARACFPIVMQHLANDCRKISLSGVAGIKSVLARQVPCAVYDSESGEQIDNCKQWLIESDGDNVLGSFALRGIDHRKTRSNNPVQIAKVLGIEAARQSLFDELRAVLQFDGAYVNYRHISLLCDIMTSAGSLMAVSRHGLNRRTTGPLMRATLEESVSMLADAGCFSEFDPMAGPSERVATGRPFAHGTGSNGAVMLDLAALQNAKEPKVVPFVNSFPQNKSLEWDVSTSPFAPLIDANRERMFEEMRKYVTAEKERYEDEKAEHNRALQKLRQESTVCENIDLHGQEMPFSRDQWATEKEQGQNLQNEDLPGIDNPFALLNAKRQKCDEEVPSVFSNPFQKSTTTTENGQSRLKAKAFENTKYANPFASEFAQTTRNTAAQEIRKKNIYFYVPSVAILHCE